MCSATCTRKVDKMWTIVIGFIITLTVFGYFIWPALRQNYRVSLWHYLMASNPKVPEGTTTCSSVPPVDTIPAGTTNLEQNPPEKVSEVSVTPIVAPETKENSPIGDIDVELKSEPNEKVGKEAKETVTPIVAPENGDTKGKELEKVPKDSQMETDSKTPPKEEHSENVKDKMETEMETVLNSGGDSNELSQESDPTKSADEIGTNQEIVPNSGDNPIQDSKSPNKSADEGEWEVNRGKKKNKKSEKDISPGGAYDLRSTKRKRNEEWENFVKGLSRELQQLMGGFYASEDTETYLAGYPNAKDYPYLSLNLDFYQNQIPSAPDGDYVDRIHKGWFGRYAMLEQHHSYIQWLFPIQEQGLNREIHPLQKHEIERLKKDKEMRNRLIASYELMLDFFGMKLANRESGKISRSDQNQKQQYRLLNTSFHNYLRITRILKCLGEFNFEHFQAPFCEFVISEIFENRELTNTLKSCLSYWGKVIRDFEQRKEFYTTADKFIESDVARKGGIVKRELNKFFY